MKIAVLGCGNMAQAVVKGMALQFTIDFHTYTPSFSKANALAKAVLGVAHKKMRAIPHCNIYLIACKPQQFPTLADELGEFLPADAIIVSLLAGTPVKNIQTSLKVKKVLRVMPNTPTLVAAGVNALYFSPSITTQESQSLINLFKSFSEVFIFNEEEQIDIITPFSGSGPAYVFEIARIMTEKMQSMGISHTSAKHMVAQTLYGSAKLLKESHDEAEVLRNNVTSHEGVTAAALQVFNQHNLSGIFSEAIDAAYLRAQELAKD